MFGLGSDCVLVLAILASVVALFEEICQNSGCLAMLLERSQQKCYHEGVWLEMEMIFDVMCEFFDRDDWVYTKGRVENTVVTNHHGTYGTWTCIAYAAEPQRQFAFYSILPSNAPIHQRDMVGEYLHRLNYGLLVGNFEIDWEDGEVRFKTSIDVEGSSLSLELVRNTVYANVIQFDQYLPGILGVLHGGLTIREALLQCGR